MRCDPSRVEFTNAGGAHIQECSPVSGGVLPGVRSTMSRRNWVTRGKIHSERKILYRETLCLLLVEQPMISS